MHDYQRTRVMMLLDPEIDPLGAGYHIINLKLLSVLVDYMAKVGYKGLSLNLNFTRAPYRLYFCRTRRRIRTDWCFNPTNALYTLNCSRSLSRDKSTKYIWQSHDWWINADLLCLCFRQYWYGEWDPPSSRRAITTGKLWGSALIVLMAGFGIVMSIHTHRKLLSKSL